MHRVPYQMLFFATLFAAPLPVATGRAATPASVALEFVSRPFRSSDPVLVTWKNLNDLNLDTGLPTASLKALNGKSVKIAAFIVPLEDDMQQSDEFLLVPYFGACIHTPPPPANQMIYVKMVGHKTVKIGWWDPVMFEGVIHIQETDSPYGATSYIMDGVASTPYKPAKP
jgi:hypothetical protein